MVQKLEEYICGEITNVYETLAPLQCNIDTLKESIQIAHQLHDMCALQEAEELKFSEPQLSLALKLENAISSLSEMLNADNADLLILDNQIEFKQANKIIHNLKDTLHSVITFTLSQVDEQQIILDDTKAIICPEDPMKNNLIENIEQSDINLSVVLSNDVEICESISDISSIHTQKVTTSNENNNILGSAEVNVVTVTKDINEVELKNADNSVGQEIHENKNFRQGI